MWTEVIERKVVGEAPVEVIAFAASDPVAAMMADDTGHSTPQVAVGHTQTSGVRYSPNVLLQHTS
jgi:hypothetical protein